MAKRIKIAPTTPKKDPLIIAGKKFNSRLLLGTGKYASPKIMKKALAASGAAIVTVALRRVDLKKPRDHILSYLDPKKILILPNTSGARDAEEAIRLARLARALGLPSWVKLEVTPDPRYFLPDPIETLKAAEILVKEGFTVLPYINADPILAKKLEEVGCATVMPLGSPIGSAQGIKTRANLEIIIEQARVPVVVDAGLGSPSQAADAMELGAQAVLINTAIASSENPERMAYSFRLAVEAGRLAYLAGLVSVSSSGRASSPLHL